MPKKKKIILENLAEMIQKGFLDMGGRIDKGFKENREDHEAFRARFNNLDRRLDVLVEENSKAHKSMHTRIGKVEQNLKKEIAKIRHQFKKVTTEKEFVKLKERVEALEQKVGLVA